MIVESKRNLDSFRSTFSVAATSSVSILLAGFASFDLRVMNREQQRRTAHYHGGMGGLCPPSHSQRMARAGAMKRPAQAAFLHCFSYLSAPS